MIAEIELNIWVDDRNEPPSEVNPLLKAFMRAVSGVPGYGTLATGLWMGPRFQFGPEFAIPPAPDCPIATPYVLPQPRMRIRKFGQPTLQVSEGIHLATWQELVDLVEHLRCYNFVIPDHYLYQDDEYEPPDSGP